MGWAECASGVDITWGLVSVGREALVDVLDVLFVVECHGFRNFFLEGGNFQQVDRKCQEIRTGSEDCD